MALENLKENIIREKEILKEISNLNYQLDKLGVFYPNEKNTTGMLLLNRTLNSLIEQLRIINNSIPEILNSISIFKSLENRPEKAENLIKISYPAVPGAKEKVSITVEKKEKEHFLGQLSLSRDTIRRLKEEKKIVKKEDVLEFKKAGAYARLANRFFMNLSNKYINKGYFKGLNSDLRKANMPHLLVTYLSISFLSSLIGAAVGIIAFVFFIIFLPSSLAYSWLILFLPFFVFMMFYVYPGLEGSSAGNKIDQEIPFVTIHMSAVAGSGIEPTQIFKIIAMGEEYPETKIEFKKIINQVNVYGYDLVTALKNTARETSSKKLAELLNGMASSITGGSKLNEYLDKRAETLLFEYKLDKEKYAKETETFMDIYISIMIAAPMIMTLLLVLISISGLSIGLSLQALTILIIAVVSLINIVFMIFLRISQTNY